MKMALPVCGYKLRGDFRENSRLTNGKPAELLFVLSMNKDLKDFLYLDEHEDG
jgi:hypothetical protein